MYPLPQFCQQVPAAAIGSSGNRARHWLRLSGIGSMKCTCVTETHPKPWCSQRGTGRSRAVQSVDGRQCCRHTPQVNISGWRKCLTAPACHIASVDCSQTNSPGNGSADSAGALEALSAHALVARRAVIVTSAEVQVLSVGSSARLVIDTCGELQQSVYQWVAHPFGLSDSSRAAPA